MCSPSSRDGRSALSTVGAPHWPAKGQSNCTECNQSTDQSTNIDAYAPRDSCWSSMPTFRADILRDLAYSMLTLSCTLSDRCSVDHAARWLWQGGGA